jgi:hypothetical protein
MKTIDLDVLQAEADYAPFRFVLDGKQHQLPHVQMLSTEQALRVEQGEARTVIAEIAGDELADRIMKLPAFATNALLEGWLAHAGLTSGESEASTGS